MLVPGNLGFQSLILFLGWIAFLVIRHKWRNDLAKQEEIMRLAAMASEEAVMAEADSTIQYCSVPMLRCSQCAVCFRPTTMRCSQCKDVRYCSGKCQIIHWRQGHRDECYQTTASLPLDEGVEFGEKAVLQHQSEVSKDAFVMERKSKISFQSISSKDNDSYINKPCAERGEENTDFPSPNMSSSTDFTPYGRTSESNNVFSKDVLGSDTSEELEIPLPGDISPNRPILKSKSSKGKKLIAGDVHPMIVGNKKQTRGAPTTEKLDADSSSLMGPVSQSAVCLRSDFVSYKGEDNSQLFNSKESRSFSSHASKEHLSSTVGGHLVSSTKSTDGFHALPAKSGGNASLPQNVSNGLKTSMRKVVQQFKVSKQSKSSHHGLGNDVSGRYNCKLIFPYELFVELYCYNKVDFYPFGLSNCGNSCYANAVLQCLAYTRPFTSYLLQGIHSKACRKKEWCFICEFECLVLKAREGTSPLSPVRILSRINKIGSHLSHGRQEDAHEFLRYAVDAMQSVCLKEAGTLSPLAEETTLVGLTFGGHLLSKIKCLKCHAKSEMYERMMDLTVEIDGDIGTLEEALAQFTATETLERDNKYRCSRCKSYEKARKKLKVLEAPNILTIVLKRFQSGNFEKLNKLVKFPEILNMAPYMSGPSDDSPLYSLYGVVVHLDTMNASFSGHYVCYVKNFHGDWFKIDDSMVEPVVLERVLSEGAYMLLYARHSPRPPAVVRSGKIKKRSLEALPSSSNFSKSKSRSSSVPPKTDNSSMLQRKSGKNPYWKTNQGPSGSQMFDPEDWRFHSVQRIHRIDSSSESSSIFSSSDASSCSTTSTKDSVATEDLSEYIFGDAGSTWYNSPYGIPSDSGESSSYQNYDECLRGDGERNSSWHWGRAMAERLDCSSNNRSISSSSNRSSSREAESDQFVYGNSRSGVVFSISGDGDGDDGSAQTFY